MVNSHARLSSKIFSDNISGAWPSGLDRIPTRQGYGEGLVIAGEEDERVVVLCADLTESTRSILFKERFPERFIEVGVAEQLLATAAAGMANYGKIPFISSYAAFSPGRNWEQIRTTIALNDVPVKIAGAHAGISVGPDGATHQMLEDIAMMRTMPNMTVVVPCDSLETKKATVAIVKNGKPSYIRLFREKTPVFTTNESAFEIGKANILWGDPTTASGRARPEVGIIACGPLVYEALLAAKKLEESGIESIVVNNHTIKPMDEEAIVRVARLTGAIVTVEEHQIMGGMGSAVAEVLSRVFPVPIEYIGMPDSYGESGEPDELLQKYGMNSVNITEAVKKVIKRKLERE